MNSKETLLNSWTPQSGKFRFCAAPANVAADATQNFRTCNMAAALDADWHHKNRLIRRNDKEPIADPPKPTKCFNQGFCTCTLASKLLEGIRNKLLRAIKEQCPRGSALRDLLMQGPRVPRPRWHSSAKFQRPIVPRTQPRRHWICASVDRLHILAAAQPQPNSRTSGSQPRTATETIGMQRDRWTPNFIG